MATTTSSSANVSLCFHRIFSYYTYSTDKDWQAPPPPSAAQRVFSIQELLELVLLQEILTVSNLFVIQRVDRTFQSTIKGSTPIRRKMVLEQSPSSKIETSQERDNTSDEYECSCGDLNPILRDECIWCDTGFVESYDRPPPFNRFTFDYSRPNLVVSFDPDESHPNASRGDESWRDMMLFTMIVDHNLIVEFKIENEPQIGADREIGFTGDPTLGDLADVAMGWLHPKRRRHSSGGQANYRDFDFSEARARSYDSCGVRSHGRIFSGTTESWRQFKLCPTPREIVLRIRPVGRRSNEVFEVLEETKLVEGKDLGGLVEVLEKAEERYLR